MSSGVKRLPFFPTPYPDECFYSILCRYHVRSGMPSSPATIRSLFGKNYVISSTLHTAFRAEYMAQWVDPCSGLTPKYIAYRHSSYQLMLLNFIDQAALYPVNYSQTSLREYLKIPYKKLYIFSHIIGKRHGKICFCPECAAEERKIYGEPYWHVLHQIKGVEFCPVHGVPILETEICYGLRRTAFFPASLVVNEGSDYNSSSAASKCNEYERRKLIHLASDIGWLLKNGLLFNRGKSISAALLKGKMYDTKRYVDCIANINHILSNSPLTRIYSENEEKDFMFNYHLPLSAHPVAMAYLMGKLYGSAQSFYDAVYISVSDDDRIGVDLAEI